MFVSKLWGKEGKNLAKLVGEFKKIDCRGGWVLIFPLAYFCLSFCYAAAKWMYYVNDNHQKPRTRVH